jgi:hypothetical protein
MWDWVVWGALAAGGIVTLGGLALLGVRGLQAWREFKRIRRRILAAMDSLSAAGEAVAEKADTVGDSDELQASLARLRRSLAQLALLQEAVEDVRRPLGLVSALAPRK